MAISGIPKAPAQELTPQQKQYVYGRMAEYLVTIPDIEDDHFVKFVSCCNDDAKFDYEVTYKPLTKERACKVIEAIDKKLPEAVIYISHTLASYGFMEPRQQREFMQVYLDAYEHAPKQVSVTATSTEPQVQAQAAPVPSEIKRKAVTTEPETTEPEKITSSTPSLSEIDLHRNVCDFLSQKARGLGSAYESIRGLATDIGNKGLGTVLSRIGLPAHVRGSIENKKLSGEELAQAIFEAWSEHRNEARNCKYTMEGLLELLDDLELGNRVGQLEEMLQNMDILEEMKGHGVDEKAIKGAANTTTDFSKLTIDQIMKMPMEERHMSIARECFNGLLEWQLHVTKLGLTYSEKDSVIAKCKDGKGKETEVLFDLWKSKATVSNPNKRMTFGYFIITLMQADNTDVVKAFCNTPELNFPKKWMPQIASYFNKVKKQQVTNKDYL